MAIVERIEAWQQARNYLSELQDQLDETAEDSWEDLHTRTELNEAIYEQLFNCVAAANLLVGELGVAVNFDWKALEKLASS